MQSLNDDRQNVKHPSPKTGTSRRYRQHGPIPRRSRSVTEHSQQKYAKKKQPHACIVLNNIVIVNTSPHQLQPTSSTNAAKSSISKPTCRTNRPGWKRRRRTNWKWRRSWRGWRMRLCRWRRGLRRCVFLKYPRKGVWKSVASKILMIPFFFSRSCKKFSNRKNSGVKNWIENSRCCGKHVSFW